MRLLGDDMENNRRTLTFLLLLLALLFGTFVRVLPVLQAGFPLNDGGLFYTMTSDLQKADYALPAVTTYNRLDIPYAYPPLPFYLMALIRSITGADLLDIIRWLPVVFSLLTIPAFFLLAQALLGDPLKAALATVMYALLPRSYEWVIMGGGVTRAPAALFLILMTWGVYRLFRSGGWKFYLVTILSAALVILTHPERSLHALATAGHPVALFRAQPDRPEARRHRSRRRAGVDFALVDSRPGSFRVGAVLPGIPVRRPTLAFLVAAPAAQFHRRVHLTGRPPGSGRCCCLSHAKENLPAGLAGGGFSR